RTSHHLDGDSCAGRVTERLLVEPLEKWQQRIDRRRRSDGPAGHLRLVEFGAVSVVVHLSLGPEISLLLSGLGDLVNHAPCALNEVRCLSAEASYGGETDLNLALLVHSRCAENLHLLLQCSDLALKHGDPRITGGRGVCPRPRRERNYGGRD